MKVSEINSFLPRWASPPGETISELLIAKRLGLEEFVQLLDITQEKAQALIAGKAVITAHLAHLLEQYLGGSAAFWLNRESQYRRDLSRLHRDASPESEWPREFPIVDMRKFGWISSTSDNVAHDLLRFFDVADVTAWREKYRDLIETIAFRTSPAFESELGAVAAWIRQGEHESESIQCERWTPAHFKETLTVIRQLTRQKYPASFLPELRARCAACGVAVVVLRAPAGCHASGATHFLSQDKAMLLLSFRYLSDDHFWFSFFHEAGHLLLHDRTALFVEGTDVAVDEDEEREANEFAENVLIPAEFRTEMLRLPINGIAVVRFAREIGVSPGIVVGQLQHHGRLTHRQLNNLKRRFVWTDKPPSAAKPDEDIG